ncbi:MAG: hypothetical protein UT43_C0020G0003 [Parcubacteria group bacterium GW2011_GWC1_39_29]|nr:MAG: hypothetical protein UT43_C0020G0003 [Parcubacteria group bacterium GW2011_GWC1_39_29]
MLFGSIVKLVDGFNNGLGNEWGTGGLTNVDEREMVKEFIEIYNEFYKSKISDGDARKMAQNLLNAYKIVYRMPPEMAVSVLSKIE